MLRKIELKMIGYKELIISLCVVLGVYSLFILKEGIFEIGGVIFIMDVVMPIAFSIPTVILFTFYMTSEMSNIIKVYGNKSYNKYLLFLIIKYLSIITVIYIILSGILLSLNSSFGVGFEWKETVFEGKELIFLFLRTYLNVIFLNILVLFILKISKNNVFTFFSVGMYVFQEISGDGSYTEPVNLFISYEPRSMYNIETILMNRGFFIVLTLGMLYYIVRKNN
ncbi:MAG: hypothetical protein ACRDAU_05215 [Clostridium sp.]